MNFGPLDLGMLDHLLAAVIFLALPFFGIWDGRRMKAAVAAGAKDARLGTYRRTMIVEWVLAFSVLAIWLGAGRGWVSLGFGFVGGLGWWVGLGLTVAAIVFLALQTRAVLGSEEHRAKTRKELDAVEGLTPTNDQESQAFAALSITAGICEEVLYRGFLIAYLAALLGPWPALALSALAFGLGHVYQGWIAIPKIGAIGLLVGGLYLLTGSLWLPVLLHIAGDLNSGHLARRLLEPSGPQPAQMSN